MVPKQSEEAMAIALLPSAILKFIWKLMNMAMLIAAIATADLFWLVAPQTVPINPRFPIFLRAATRGTADPNLIGWDLVKSQIRFMTASYSTAMFILIHFLPWPSHAIKPKRGTL